MPTTLRPAERTRRPNDDIVSPCASSCSATATKRPATNTAPPEPDVLGDDERRAVAAGDEVHERGEPGDAEQRLEHERDAG